MLAKNVQAKRTFRQPASSLTSIASKLAPTGCRIRIRCARRLSARCSSGRSLTGRLLIDEEILRENGVSDFEHYRFEPGSDAKLMPDLFVD